jgi:hypothetical protein
MANIAVKAVYGVITILLGIFVVFPLVIFAIFTFTLATWFLSIVVLCKGLGAIRLSILQWWQGDSRDSPEDIAERERRETTAAQAQLLARSQPGSTSASQSSSSSSNGTTRRHSNSHNSNASFATLPQVDHDYESISGWLHPEVPSNGGNFNNDNSSQTSLSTLTRRPDTTPPIYRRRSFGASSSGINSPESLNRHSATGLARFSQGSGSPQSYSNNGTAARSTTSVNSRRGSVMAARRESEAIGSGSESEGT